MKKMLYRSRKDKIIAGIVIPSEPEKY